MTAAVLPWCWPGFPQALRLHVPVEGRVLPLTSSYVGQNRQRFRGGNRHRLGRGTCIDIMSDEKAVRRAELAAVTWRGDGVDTNQPAML